LNVTVILTLDGRCCEGLCCGSCTCKINNTRFGWNYTKSMKDTSLGDAHEDDVLCIQ